MSVRDYYDSNTRKFLFLGAQRAIHRELYGPGVASKDEAMHYAHELIVEQVDRVSPDGGARVLDLGCGVGATCFYLADRRDAQLTGVSISPEQVEIAREWNRRRARPERCNFVEADFAALPTILADFDLAFSIEAFIHSTDPRAYFESCARVLRQGGRLVIIDDILVEESEDQELMEAFRRGWMANSVLTVDELELMGAEADLKLIEDESLSDFMYLERPRDRLVRVCQPLLKAGARRSYWCRSLVGGDALQQLLLSGHLQHRKLVFEKRG